MAAENPYQSSASEASQARAPRRRLTWVAALLLILLGLLIGFGLVGGVLIYRDVPSASPSIETEF